ncbi:MAG: FAD-dependent oxidoreductase [Hyphomicrobiaceae bacterium]
MAAPAHLAPLFQPLRIKGLEIRNRFLSTSHSPGYASGGDITDRFIAYEAEKAKGGVGLVQFGGATAVSVENSFHYGQINGSLDAVVPQYKRMSDAIHTHGAKCMVQLTHGGRRERWDGVNWLPAFAPSCRRELIHRSFPAEMEHHDIARVVTDYASAVRRAREGGLDGVEVSCQATTLIEQFWSPITNFREDQYGGSFENRVRFGREILEAIRAEVGHDYVVGIRMPGDEKLEGGLTKADCVEIARYYADTGLIDFISVVGGHATDYKGGATIWPTMWLPSAGHLPLADAVKKAVKVAVFHASRITDAATAVHAVREGILDMVGMTRAFIADPEHIRKLESGRDAEIRPCVGTGYCVDRVLKGQDALCAHNVATSRETTIPQVVPTTKGQAKHVVVVGGGPGGLEAARSATLRGHRVTLLEAASELGGQVILASRATWRREIIGITRFLSSEMARLGVDVRLSSYADADDVLALKPDIVITATGGTPNVGFFGGRELATSTWDILSGQATPGREVLVLDESGGPVSLSTAEVLAKGGAKVEIVTPDRAVGMELSDINLGAHMNELHALGVAITSDTKLVSVARSGNRLEATLASMYSGKRQTRTVDQVVGDCGTLANDELYEALKPSSRNLGEYDLRAISELRLSVPERNAKGAFDLFKIGDAWASRNIHAAMLDARRICQNL